MASDGLKHLSPKEIWEEEIDPAKVLVVKNISPAITVESLQNYLEVVTRKFVVSLYFHPAVTSISLAVLDEEIADLEEVQKKAQKRPLEKTVLDLLPLGGSSGLLLSDISGPVGDDGLTLYFESKKCGSPGVDVDDCKLLSDLNICIIQITVPPEVLRKIVNKSDHQTGGVTFAVEPYYPSFHDPVLNTLQSIDIKAVRSNMANKSTEIATPKPAIPHKPPSTRALNPESSATHSPVLKPTGLQNNSPESLHPNQQENKGFKAFTMNEFEKNTELASSRPLITPKISSPRRWGPIVQELKSFPFHTGPYSPHYTNEQNAGSAGGEPEEWSWGKDIQNTSNISQSSSEAENEVIFSNNLDDETVPAPPQPIRSSENLGLASSNSDTNEYSTKSLNFPNSKLSPSDALEPQAYKKDRQKPLSGGLKIFTDSLSPFSIASVVSKPIFPQCGHFSMPGMHPSEEMQETYTKVAESSNHKKSGLPEPHSNYTKISPIAAVSPMRQGQSDGESQGYMDAGEESETVPLTLEKIMLLIIDAFPKKCKPCKITLDTKQELVRFIGQKNDVQMAKLKMFETLERKREMTSSSELTELHKKLFGLQKTKNAVKTMLKSKRICAVVLMKEDNHLHSYALKDSEAKSGLDLIEQSLVQSSVNLREGQDKLLAGSEWTSLIQGIEQKHKIKIQQDTRKVEVGGLNQVEVDQAKIRIITFLKQKTPQNTFKETIYGAIARCFKAELADGVREKLKSAGGNLKLQDLPPHSGSDKFQLEVEIIGSDVELEIFRTALKSIWHEKLDFHKMCNSDDDIQLITAALSRKGKDFLKSFEGRHCCYIDLTLPRGIKFEKPSKHSAPYRKRTNIDFPSRQHAAKSDNSKPMVHLKVKKHAPPPKAQRYFKEHIFQRADSAPNLFHVGPLQFPIKPKSGLPTRDEHLKRHRTDDSLSHPDISELASLQSVPHTPHIVRWLHKNRLEDVQQAEPRVMHRNRHQQHMVSKGTEENSDGLRRGIQIGQISIVVKQGDIVKEQAYALMNIVPPSRDLSKGSVISQSFVRAGGPELVQMYQNKVQSEEDGFVVTQSAGNLKCDIVLHVMLRTHVHDTEREVRKVMKTCYKICQLYGVTSLALPPLGCGRLHGYDQDSVVEAMLDETSKLALGAYRRIRKVTIVVYDQDICQKFLKKLSSLETQSTQSLSQYQPDLDLSEVCQEEEDIDKELVISDDQRTDHNQDDDDDDDDDDGSGGDDNDDDDVSGGEWISLPHSESSPAMFDLRDQQQHTDQDNPPSKRHEREIAPKNAKQVRAANVSTVTVKIVAKDKQACFDCVKKLAKEMKENYLFESEPVNKKHKLPPEDKKKIRDILSEHETSVEQKQVKGDAYILKGWKEEVYAAHNAILKVLSETSGTIRRRKVQHKRRSPDFWHFKAYEEPETPEYWSMGSNVIQDIFSKFMGLFKGKKSKLEKVDSETFQEIVKLVDDTWQRHLIGKGNDAMNLTHSGIKVSKIKRVENLDLYESYFKKRQEIFKSLWKSKQESFPQLDKIKGCRDGYIKTSRGGKYLSREMYPEINEYYFFHGTKVDKIDAICENGLDCRLGSEKGMLGAGVYGAESSTKADQYTDSKQGRTPGKKKMFLMRMVLGNIYVCTESNPHKYRRPPCRTCYKDDCTNAKHTEGYYDSVVGDMAKLFREFVVYDKNQCYPEYIITYDRV